LITRPALIQNRLTNYVAVDQFPENLPGLWDMPAKQGRILEAGGEGAAAKIVSKLGAKAEVVRELCYRLYTLCERKKRAAEALSYNGLVQSWPEITRLAREDESKNSIVRESQTTMYGQE
jgi:putative DNA methylase